MQNTRETVEFEMDDPDDDQDAVRPWLHDNRKMRSERNFFPEKINYEKLWTFTDWDPLLGCVPVQTSKTLSGLLTGMNLVLKKREFRLISRL